MHQATSHHGPNAFSCGHAFGTRRASGPNFKKAASFFSMALVPLHPRRRRALCNTANPTKPISITACYLLLPRLCRLYHQTNCIHGNHRRSSLGDSKNHSVSLGGGGGGVVGGSYLSRPTAGPFPGLLRLLPRHLGIPSPCPLPCLISSNSQHTRCSIPTPKRQLGLCRRSAPDGFILCTTFWHENSLLTQRMQPLYIYLKKNIYILF